MFRACLDPVWEGGDKISFATLFNPDTKVKHFRRLGRRVSGALTYGRCQLRAGTVVSSIRLPFSRHLSRILSVALSFTLYKWCRRLVVSFVGKISPASPRTALFSGFFDLSIGFFGSPPQIGSSKFSRHASV